MKSHEIYKLLDHAIVAELFTTFRDEERDVYKSALANLAQVRKLRPVFVQKKPVAEQIKWMHKTLTLRGTDMVGEHLLQVWFMKFQQPLLVEFCDGMGIDHNGEGSVEGTLPEELDPEKLDATVESLYANYNPRVVSLYLHVFNLQTPGGWEGLTNLLDTDDRIRLGNEPEEPAPVPDAEPKPAEAPEAESQPKPQPEPEESPADPPAEESSAEAPPEPAPEEAPASSDEPQPEPGHPTKAESESDLAENP